MKFIDQFGLAAIQKLPPELAHTATIIALKSGLAAKAKKLTDQQLSLLKVELPISRLAIKNPLGIAAGFDKNAEVFAASLAMGCGFVECGSVTPQPQAGNAKPRLFRLKEDGGVINRMGFNNEGLHKFVQNLENAEFNSGIVGANVGANKTSLGAARIEDYTAGIKAVWQHCSYLTLNISSPNTPGLRGLQNRSELEELLGAASVSIQEMCDLHKKARPVFLKIAPDVDDEAIKDIVGAVLDAEGVTGLIVSNTTIARPASLKSPYASEVGGLSGKPLFDKSTEVLAKVARMADKRLDIVGVGGVYNAATAYKKIRSGADCFQLYSALVYDGAPLISEILTGLSELLEADGYSNISEAVGVDL